MYRAIVLQPAGLARFVRHSVGPNATLRMLEAGIAALANRVRRWDG